MSNQPLFVCMSIWCLSTKIALVFKSSSSVHSMFTQYGLLTWPLFLKLLLSTNLKTKTNKTKMIHCFIVSWDLFVPSLQLLTIPRVDVLPCLFISLCLHIAVLNHGSGSVCLCVPACVAAQCWKALLTRHDALVCQLLSCPPLLKS